MASRGFNPTKQKCWINAIEKENYLRMKWFVKNEKRLDNIAHQAITHVVPQDLIDQVKEDRIASYRSAVRQTVNKIEIIPPVVPGELLPIMRPVQPQVTQILYKSANKDGRQSYLKERIKTIPEDRYYFPETTSFEYGWKMWNTSKQIQKTGFGRQQVVRRSFYRRRGIERDPDWYKEPIKLSPTICSQE